MSKDIIYRQRARKTFQAGLDALANAVKVTLGPRGRNVALERTWGTPLLTKDGVTVAEEIELSSKSENMGALLVKEVAQRTNTDIGDGTTTATVLAQAIYSEGVRLVEADIPVMEIKRGIDFAVRAAVEGIDKQSKMPKNGAETAMVATISANGDAELGALIAEAFEKVGKDGVVTVEESQLMETTLAIVEGMEFDRGYLSPYFITDKQALTAELKKPLILIHEQKLSSLQDVLPALEAAQKAKAPLLIIAEDVEGEALAALVVNKLRGVLESVAVKAPGFGDRRKEMIKDMAALVGATPFCEDLGRKADSVTLADLGRCDRVVVSKETCQIIKGHGKKADIQARIALINAENEATNSTYDKEKLQERLARISGGVAVLKVGGATEVEVRERKYRVEDAKHATRAALQEGYVPGGGVALIRASQQVENLFETLEGGELAGAKLIASALKRPLWQIATNAGEDAAVVVDKVSKGKGAFGFDAQALEYGDLVIAGILDPAKVVKVALTNAASVASLMLTTDALIIEKPKPKAPSGASAGMGGMDMGMGGMGGMDMGDHDH